MKPAKVYKVNLEEHWIRSFFFRDEYLAVGLACLVGVMIYFYFQVDQALQFTTWLFITAIIILLFIGQTEGQKNYKIMFKMLKYLTFTNKSVRHSTSYKLAKSPAEKRRNLLAKFSVIDSFLLFPDRLVAILKIEPVDYFLMKPSDQSLVQAKLVDLLHSYREEEFQIISRVREVESEDFTDFLAGLVTRKVYAPNEKSRESRRIVLEQFMRNFPQMVDRYAYPVQDHFIVVHVRCNTKDPKSTLDASVILQEKCRYVAGTLSEAGFKIKLMQDTQDKKELSKTVTKLVRDIANF